MVRRTSFTLAAGGVLALSLLCVGVWYATRGDAQSNPPRAAEPPAVEGFILEFPAYSTLPYNLANSEKDQRNAAFRVRCPSMPIREPGQWIGISQGWETYHQYTPSIYTLPSGSVELAADGRETALPDGTRVVVPGTKPENEKPIRQIHPRPDIEEQPEDKPEPLQPRPVAIDGKPGTLVLIREGEYKFLTPEGKEVPARPRLDKDQYPIQCALSPDGKLVAVGIVEEVKVRKEEKYPGWRAQYRRKVVVHALDVVEPLQTWEFAASDIRFAWALDGKSIVLTKWLLQAPHAIENVRLDLATGKSETLPLPLDTIVLDCARDGKTFVAAWPVVGKGNGYHYHLGLVALGKKQPLALTEVELSWKVWPIVGRLSPDETTILFLDSDPGRKDAHRWMRSIRPFVIDIQTRNRTAVEGMPETGRAYGAAWSPDGKRIAYTSWNVPADFFKMEHVVFSHGRETESVLIVADTNGRNAKVVTSQKGPYAKPPYAESPMFHTIDWR